MSNEDKEQDFDPMDICQLCDKDVHEDEIQGACGIWVCESCKDFIENRNIFIRLETYCKKCNEFFLIRQMLDSFISPEISFKFIRDSIKREASIHEFSCCKAAE